MQHDENFDVFLSLKIIWPQQNMQTPMKSTLAKKWRPWWNAASDLWPLKIYNGQSHPYCIYVYERVHQSYKGIKNPVCVYRCMSTYYRFPSYSRILNKFNMNIRLHKTQVNLTLAISVFTRGTKKSRIVNAEEIVQVAILEKATYLIVCWVFFLRFCCHLLTFLKIDFFINVFQEHYQSVK